MLDWAKTLAGIETTGTPDDIEYRKRINDPSPMSNNVVQLNKFDPKKCSKEIERLQSAVDGLQARRTALQADYEEMSATLAAEHQQALDALHEQQSDWLQHTALLMRHNDVVETEGEAE